MKPFGPLPLPPRLPHPSIRSNARPSGRFRPKMPVSLTRADGRRSQEGPTTAREWQHSSSMQRPPLRLSSRRGCSGQPRVAGNAPLVDAVTRPSHRVTDSPHRRYPIRPVHANLAARRALRRVSAVAACATSIVYVKRSFGTVGCIACASLVARTLLIPVSQKTPYGLGSAAGQ